MNLQGFHQDHIPQIAIEVEAAPKVAETPKGEPMPKAESIPQAPAEPHRLARAVDEFAPGYGRESAGIYRASLNAEGKPVVSWDDVPSEGKEEPEDSVSETTMNTDKVDRELEALRKEKETLEHQLQQEQDPARAKELERKLSQTNQELQQKDNDTYRRQHAVIS